jgi:Tfp pilus assembly protein FimT
MRLIIALAIVCVLGAAAYAISRVRDRRERAASGRAAFEEMLRAARAEAGRYGHVMGPWAAAADGACTATCGRCAGPLTGADVPAQPGSWEISYGESLAAGAGEMRVCGAAS